MKIKKVDNLKKMSRGQETILVNLTNQTWVKVQEMTLQIIDSIDGMEVQEALTKVVEDYQVPHDQAEAFVNFMVDRGFLEKGIEHKYLKLMDEDQIKPEPRFSHVYVHITNRCNLRCGYCYYDASIDENKELKTHEVKNIIRRLSLNKVNSIAFSGGEPMLRKDLEELLIYSKKFFNDVGMVTNATLVTPENARAYGQYLTKLQISIDSGIKADHETIRGQGTFERTVRGIQYFREILGSDNIKIAPTINRLNIAGIESIVGLAKDLDVRLEARFFLPSGRGSCNQNQFAITDDEMIEAFERIWQECARLNYDKYSIEYFYNTQVGVKKSCGACRETLCVDVNGDLYPCGFLMDERIKIANIFDGLNLYEMIEKSEIGQQILQRDVDQIPGCQDCNVRYFCGGGCMGIAYGATGTIQGKDAKCPYYHKLYEKLVWLTEGEK